VIRRDHRLETTERARQRAAALAEAAAGVADAVHSLIPGCTAAVVVVEQGSEWTLLAQRGSVDVSRSWRRLVAHYSRVCDDSWAQGDSLVAAFPSQRLHAMLVTVPIAGISLPPGMRTIVQPLLDAGGILLDAAVAGAPARAQGVLRLVPDPEAFARLDRTSSAAS
jgi:hypothetical protein